MNLADLVLFASFLLPLVDSVRIANASCPCAVYKNKELCPMFSESE